MTEPLHYFGDTLDPSAFGQLRSRDHDHGNAKHTSRVDLGARAVAAGIAGDDPRDLAGPHHLELALKRERPTRHDHIRGKGQGPFGRIDEPQRVGMLRLACERRDVLAADGEEHVCGRGGQRGDRSVDIGDLNPVVAGRFQPRRAFECDQLRAGLRARLNSIAAHLGGERMRGVDHMRDAFAADGVGQPVHAAEAADTGRQRLVGRRAGATAIGVDGVDACARDLRCELARIGRSAQNEGAYG